MSFIEIKNLTKRFSDTLAVDNISLNIEKGELFGLLGPNGAGKSTLISMLCGICSIDSGDILINGISVKKEPKKAKSFIGYVPQDIALFEDLSIHQNLEFFGGMYGLSRSKLKEKIEETLDIIALKDKRKAKVKTLSGGMKRRLNIACAIMHEPEILVMDEPTVGIDPQSRNHILEFTKAINTKKNTTVIYTSHYMEEVEFLCNNLSIIDLGKVLVRGSKEDIIKSFTNDLEVVVKTSNASEANIINLKSINFVNSYKLVEDTLTISATRSSYDFSKLIHELAKFNINVLNFSVNEPTLETVFLDITGKALRE